MGCGSSSNQDVVQNSVKSAPVSKPLSTRSEEVSSARSQIDTVRSEKNEQFTNPAIMLKQYTIGESIGFGAFAQVKKVIHKPTGQVRALKIIHKSGLQSQQLTQSALLQELHILQALSHPNILHLYEWFEDKLRFYVITEFCAGGELFKFISSAEHLTEAKVAEIMFQILSAVAYSHEKRIIHRDLKPENVFFTGEDLQLKVADFGSSAFLDKDRKLSGIFGSGYYIAPEVIQGGYDEKCDLWSCGIILYILLTGVAPYQGRNEQEILASVVAGKMNLRKLEEVSTDACQLIHFLLTIDPKRRISAIDALSHPWILRFRRDTQVPSRVLLGVLENLKSFHRSCMLKEAILTFIANHIISQAETKELGTAFQSLDKNGDGKISKGELMAKYGEMMTHKDAEVEVNAIMTSVDTDHNGFIDYCEFLNANLEKSKHVSKQNLDAAFRVLDRDGNGSISADELRWVLYGGGVVQDSAWEELLGEVDRNHDGEIDLKEFMSLVRIKI